MFDHYSTQPSESTKLYHNKNRLFPMSDGVTLSTGQKVSFPTFMTQYSCDFGLNERARATAQDRGYVIRPSNHQSINQATATAPIFRRNALGFRVVLPTPSEQTIDSEANSRLIQPVVPKTAPLSSFDERSFAGSSSSLLSTSSSSSSFSPSSTFASSGSRFQKPELPQFSTTYCSSTANALLATTTRVSTPNYAMLLPSSQPRPVKNSAVKKALWLSPNTVLNN
eukprot:TRINITY_DN8813_c0_g1_i1.p1 TRINITY_DN8813_c0_g1~~TRINITY_DN8813_c0_g1_i1.p1  ORF type:complete len:225 (-),score=34.94 TRINITY_DN8813_c0_g1_i1:362-1036(-)